MAANGFGYYYSKGLLSSGDLSCYLNFNDFYSGVVPVESGNPLYYLEVFGNTGDFSQQFGSGYFSGTIAKFNSGDLLPKEDLALVMVFEKITSGEQILFSSLGEEVIPSGFVFGLNDANKAYITAYNSGIGGYVTSTFESNINAKNGIALSKDNNNFTLLKYVFSEGELYEERVSLDDYCTTNGTNYYLGGVSGTDIENKPFVGYIDEFVILNSSLGVQSLGNIFSGFVLDEPALTYQLVNTTVDYKYQGLTTLSNVQFESFTSGIFDYIQNSIFDITGVGTINVLSSGGVVGNVASVSGNLSGRVSLPTGYYNVTSGQVVTGYLTSGLAATASGITGYVAVSLNPFVTTGDPDVFAMTALSGISGITRYESVFTGPLYETVYTTGFVASSILTEYNQPFYFTYTGDVTGNVRYTHKGSYTNNGSDKILVIQDLNYSGSIGQPTPFRVIKTSHLDYGYDYGDSDWDYDFVKTFKSDGVTLTNPWPTGVILELVHQNFSGLYDFNNTSILDYSSGDFRSDFVKTTGDLSLYINGVNLCSGEFRDLPLLTEDGYPILTESGEFIYLDYLAAQYIYSGRYFLSFLTWDREDTSLFDSFTSGALRRYFEVESDLDLYSGSTKPSIGNEYWFVNGQKLISGLEYTQSGSTITLLTNQLSGIGGILYSSAPGSGSVTNTYRTGISISGSNFPVRSSQVYLNGIRQIINEDYVEVGSGDLLYGAPQVTFEAFDEIFDTQNFVI